MKAYFKAVFDCMGLACLWMIAATIFCCGQALFAAGLGVSTATVTVGLLIFSMAAGVVKTAVDRRREWKTCEALDTVIKLWKKTLARIETEENTEDYAALKAAYAVTISVLEKERSRRGGRRRGG